MEAMHGRTIGTTKCLTAQNGTNGRSYMRRKFDPSIIQELTLQPANINLSMVNANGALIWVPTESSYESTGQPKTFTKHLH